MGSEKSMVIIRDCLFDCADQIPLLYMVIWECHAMTASFHWNFSIQSKKPKGKHQMLFVVPTAGYSKTVSKLL